MWKIAAPPLPVQRLDYDVIVFLAKLLDLLDRARDHCRRHQVEEIKHKDFLWCIAHAFGIIDDEGFRMDALEQMGRGDVGHVERWILPEHDHVLPAEIHRSRVAEAKMRPLFIIRLEHVPERN